MISKPLLSFSLCLCAGALFAGTPAPAPTLSESALSTAPQAKEWEFSLEPYGWLASISGNVGFGAIDPVNVDVPFREILKRLDMVAAMQAEVHHGPWSLLLDGMYLKVSDGAGTPGRLLNAIDVQLEQTLLEGAVAYRVWEGKRGYFDFLVGARYMHIQSRMNFDISASGVQSVSDDISNRVVDQAVNATQSAVNTAVNRLNAQVAAIVPDTQSALQSKKDAIQSNVRQAAVEQILENNSLVDIIQKIRALTPAQVEQIKGAKQLLQAQKELAQALVDQQVNAKIGQVQSQLSSSVASAQKKAAQAVAKAQKKLSREIEKTIRQTIPDTASAGRGWVDPFVGFRAKYLFTDNLYLTARADIGGFGVSSKLAWQAFGALGWQFHRHWAAELGYRYLAVDYDKNGFVYDTNTSGAFLGVKWSF